MFGKRSATPEPVRVLFDGWPLACPPAAADRAAGLHLLELLEALPEHIEAWLALPGTADLAVGSHVHLVSLPAAVTPGGQLQWEQSRLPGLARRVKADLLHTTSPNLSLFSPVPSLVSPVDDFTQAAAGSLLNRARQALGRGGFSGGRGVLWPADLPDPPVKTAVFRLPPRVHSTFKAAHPPDGSLPDAFILVPGPLDDQQLSLLAAAWSWICAGLDESWVLLLADMDDPSIATFSRLCEGLGIKPAGEGPRVLPVPLPSPQQRAAAFQQAAVILSIGRVRPWGDPLLQALACARPLVSLETTWADGRVGPAAFLVPPGSPRKLGAAVLSMIVDDAAAENLSQAGQLRAEEWVSDAFGQRLGEIYAQVLNKK